MIDLKSMDSESLAKWSQTFVTKAKEYAVVLGLPSGDVQRAEADSTAIGKLADATKQVRESSDPSVQDQFAKYKDMLFNGPSDQLRSAFPGAFAALTTGAAAGILPRLMGFVDKVKDSPAMTPDLAESVGLSAEKLEMLKRGEGDKVGWINSFVEKIKAHKSDLGLPDSEVKAVSEDQETMQRIEEQTAKEQVAAPDSPKLQELLNYKDMILQGPGQSLTKALPALAPALLAIAPGIIPRLQAFVQKVTHSDHYNDTIGRALGVDAPARAEVREPVGVGAREPEASGVREHRPTAPGTPTWLLPLLLVGLLGLLTYAFWPKGHKTVASHVGAGPLTITNLKVMPGPQEATVGWNTERPTTGQIEYGKTQNLELGASPKTADSASLVRIHALKLMGLERGTRYFYRVKSLDKDGNVVTSRVSTFQVP